MTALLKLTMVLIWVAIAIYAASYHTNELSMWFPILIANLWALR